MTLEDFIPLVLKISVVALVFALGLRARPHDLVGLFGQPMQFLRSVVAMNIVMVAFAVAVVIVFPLPAPIKIALIALALSPVPPILPGKQIKAGGSASYAIGLLVATSIISVVLIPLTLTLIGTVFGGDYHVSSSQLTMIMLVSVVGPLCLGMLVRSLAPSVADAIVRPIELLAIGLLALAALPIIYSTSGVILQLIGNGVVIILLLFTTVGLAVGHFLGGPVEDDRTVLALAAGTRHPGFAVAIATVNFPDEKATLAVILWHLLVAVIVSIPYVRWRKRVHRDLVGGDA